VALARGGQGGMVGGQPSQQMQWLGGTTIVGGIKVQRRTGGNKA
jgi:hypothetical protein